MQNTLNISSNTHNNVYLRIKDIINTWITEKQYSQLYVDRTYLNNLTEFWLHISCRFDDEAKYSTLVSYMTKSKIYDRFWLDQQKSYRYFGKVFDEHDWILVNLQQVGKYTINNF